MAIWLVINKEGANTLFSYNQLVVYYLGSILIKTITSSWVGQFIPGRIRRGDISPLLLRPMSFLTQWIGENIGEKLVKLIFLIPAVILFGKLLSADIPSLNFVEWLLVIISTFSGAMIFFLLDVIIGMTAFWMEETRSIKEVFGVLESLFGGRLIPLAILPLFLGKLSFILPFRYVISLPLEILLRQLTAGEIIAGLSMQAIYSLLAIFTYKLIWDKGIKLYSAAGA